MPATEVCLDGMNESPLTGQDADDAILMQRYARNGDAEAIDLLFRRFADSAFRMALRFCGNSADAEDAVQAAFLEVLRHASRYQARFSVRGWIMSIVINSCRTKIRKEAHLRQREQSISAEHRNATEPNNEDENAELAIAAVQTVQGLSEIHRLPVWLHYMEGFSFKEVADALLLPEGTVRQQANRGIEQVRQSLAAAGFTASAVAIPGLLASAPMASAPVALTASFKALITTKALSGGSAAAAGLSSASAMAKGGLSIMAKSMIGLAVVALTSASAIMLSKGHTEDAPKGDETPHAKPAQQAAGEGDWPQWRGPNRDGVAPSSPKLLDSIPASGPKMLWKSEYIPFGFGGGWGSPVVAEGKVFVYVYWGHSKDGANDGRKYGRPITTESLKLLGWIPGVPDELAKKLEAAWASPNRPNAAQCPPLPVLMGVPRLLNNFLSKNPDLKTAPHAPDVPFSLDAYLAKQPELEAYVKKFIASLNPDEAKEYDTFIKRRLCMPPPILNCPGGGEPWEILVKLSKYRDQEVKNSYKFNWEVLAKIVLMNADGSIPVWLGELNGGPSMDTLVCLDANTGKLLWKKEFGEPQKPAPGVYPHSTTPAVANGKVYFIGKTGTYCLSTKDGSVVWEQKHGASYASILVDGKFIYDPSIASALDADTGRLLWQNRDGQSGDSSPVLWTDGGKKRILCKKALMNAEDGKTLWVYPNLLDMNTPVAQGEHLLANDYDGLKGMKMTSDKPPVLLWKQGWNARDNRNSPLLYQGYVYAFDVNGAWVCGDLATGNIKWTGHKGDATDMSSPILADGKIIVFGQPGHSHTTKGCSIIIFKATPDKYEEVGRFNPHAASCESPAIADGKLYFRVENEEDDGDRGVVCYDLRAASNP